MLMVKDLVVGQRIRMKVLRDITVCQATKASDNEFNLFTGEELVGTFIERTCTGAHCFDVPKLEDEIFFPPRSISVLEGLDKLPTSV